MYYYYFRYLYDIVLMKNTYILMWAKISFYNNPVIEFSISVSRVGQREKEINEQGEHQQN